MAIGGRQETVLNLLKQLRTLEPLKQLFWSELNYRRINQALSRRGWTETAAKALVDDPVLFAAGGTNDDFHIVYSRLVSDQLLLGLERPVVSRLQADHPYALFVFSDSSQTRWHFLNVKYDSSTERRRLFRRITVGPEERLRTASERLAMIDVESLSPELFGVSPLTIQQRHDEAFDVEVVTKQFFATFADLYHKAVEDIAATRSLAREVGKLAQLLLDRMLFLYFIQKKGWLNGESDYLYSRFAKCWRDDPKGHSYYTRVLYPLFVSLSDADGTADGVGAVPFLNGGLFEESAKQTQAERLEQARLRISNATFKAIFDDLLERFNFTVTEDTPLDVEVAIDPEMLGKIFESLILQLEKHPDNDLRKLTGSYYTPRPIVHIMCREALKEYLVTQIVGPDSSKAEVARHKVNTLLQLPPADQLDDEQAGSLKELFTPAEAKTLRQAILDCRICDPAVGSGAFPVGMLHEMVAAAARLDPGLGVLGTLTRRNYDYDLKKQIVESCLYGVDIQEQAVRLCELRLWLFLDLNEAEEILRQLRRENPAEYQRVAGLRDGIRAALPCDHNQLYVFCQAGRYQQLFLVDGNGDVVSRDIPRILGAIKCAPDLEGAALPSGYNAAVMRVKRAFAEEVKHREAEREHTLSLTHGQRYVLRELRVIFGATSDEDEKARINILEKSFRGPITTAVNQELNRIRRNAVTGQSLLKALSELYFRHNMREWADRRGGQAADRPVPKVVCSEALL